jgi:hypothetical protein
MGLGLAGRIIFLDHSSNRNRLQVENEFDQSPRNHTRRDVSRKVMVEETLATHQPEGKVVGSPAKEQEGSAVVQTRTSATAPN